ncbi:hypothetical protein [Metabacillus fastidiosus]|uniref:hypothetical protein n=1 Tax=Metabacillus fastidiosus TaxID=1458 RepID=UPI002DBF99AF|nr:hypothetical protein [Metabacillus fastidiosus]MEC2074553.1 hypothetical protein [Metabacillus fastidiosus]
MATIHAFSYNRKIINSKYLNLPDIAFFKWCSERFSINKGVFNTIDNWFYYEGIEEIILRRLYILAFLDFVQTTLGNQGLKFIRFGHGGLTKRLNEFLASIN